MKKLTILSLVLFILLQVINQPLAAQSKEVISGDVAFEEEEKKKDRYPVTQDRAIEAITSLEARLESLAGGTLGTAIPALPNDVVNYLTGAYLYCISKQGVCQMLVRAVLEIDIVNARLAKKASCPNMLRFWKNWISNDFERRHKYMIGTGFMQAVGDFNVKTRPALIQCQETVETEISPRLTDSAFFKDRYGAGSEQRENIKKLKAFLVNLREKVPNVFNASGAGK